MDAKKDAPAAGGTATGAGAERTGQGTRRYWEKRAKERLGDQADDNNRD